MTDPFLIQGPAIISVSMGLSSGMLLRKIQQAHGGELPDDVKVAIANTGKEREESLRFGYEMCDRWGIEPVWVEYRSAPEPKDRWTQVTYETASRRGEPFEAVIRDKGQASQYLPNPVARYCTIELKIRPIKLYAQSLGWAHWDVAMGLRADEPARVARAKARAESGKEPFTQVMPLHEAKVVTADVGVFWSQQNFGLPLPRINGKTPHGNCDLCFLKGAKTISELMRQDPDRARWWIDRERETGNTFRIDRPSYAAMLKAVQDQVPFDFGDADELNDCVCGE